MIRGGPVTGFAGNAELAGVGIHVHPWQGGRVHTRISLGAVAFDAGLVPLPHEMTLHLIRRHEKHRITRDPFLFADMPGERHEDQLAALPAGVPV